jgi:hypothetical protein
VSKLPTEQQEPIQPSFRSDLEDLINKWSMENRSNTPDFILAEYLMSCLRSFEHATKARALWYKPTDTISSDTKEER